MRPEQVSDAFFLAGGVGIVLHIACSWLMRVSVGDDEVLCGTLFGAPLLGNLARKQWLLRGKYFWPWVPPPVGVVSAGSLLRLTFWGARLGAALVILGFAGFLLTIIWQVRYP